MALGKPKAEKHLITSLVKQEGDAIWQSAIKALREGSESMECADFVIQLQTCPVKQEEVTFISHRLCNLDCISEPSGDCAFLLHCSRDCRPFKRCCCRPVPWPGLIE